MKRGFTSGIVLWAAIAAPALVARADTASPPQIHFATQQHASRPHPAVVRVMAPGKDSISFGSGTLVAVNDKHGLVITNWHVINEATAPISVMFPDGFSSPATIIKTDRDWDLAALSIWKPNVAPVSLANAAPQAGDMLTIAGYGRGNYREATGACTQYVAPGPKFPYEMVELAAAARQGDSGGPIFNNRGQLAGVLFGEGHGRTAGSYCGRVQWFMASVVGPGQKSDAPMFVGGPSQRNVPRGQVGATVNLPVNRAAPDASNERPCQEFAATEPPLQPATPQIGTSHTSTPQITTREPESDQSFATASVAQDSPPPERMPVERPSRSARAADVAAADAEGPALKSSSQMVGWREIAGDTVGQQIKSVFAGVGALALLLHTLALFGGERK